MPTITTSQYNLFLQLSRPVGNPRSYYFLFTSDNETDRKITGTRDGKTVKGGKGTHSEDVVNTPFIDGHDFLAGLIIPAMERNR